MCGGRFGVLSVIGILLMLIGDAMPRPQGVPQAPCVIHIESPDYPELFRAAALDGTVVLRINIDKDGQVASVRVVEGPALLASESVRNVKTWVFAPAEQSNIEVRYEFRLEPPGTDKKVTPKVAFDLPSHVLIVSRRRATIVESQKIPLRRKPTQ